MAMHHPPHPGLILRDVLGETSITEAAERLSVTRAALSRIVNAKADISPEMAVRLAILLPNTDAAFWLRLQAQYDIWQVEQTPHDFVVPLSVAIS